MFTIIYACFVSADGHYVHPIESSDEQQAIKQFEKLIEDQNIREARLYRGDGSTVKYIWRSSKFNQEV